MNIMNKQTALHILFFILGAVLIFHFLIFTEQIPYDKVWAGKLKSVEEMKRFESFSILMNAFMLSILYIKYRLLANNSSNKFIDVLIWIFAGFFALNTIGNLFAKNIWELVLGTLLTLVSCALLVLVVKKRKT